MRFSKITDGPLRGETRQIEADAKFQTFILGSGKDKKMHIYEVTEEHGIARLAHHHSEPVDDIIFNGKSIC